MESKEAKTYTSSDQFTATSSKGICILLVKDDTACNNIVSDMLQHCSYEVLNSGGALDVVDAIWEIKDGLELILTNIHKLGFNGIEIARHLQKKFHLPIVLMSPDKKKIVNEKGQPFRIAAYVLNGLSRSDVGSLWQRACRKEGEKTVCNNAVENKTEDSLSVDETMFHDHRGEKRKESIDDYERKRFIEDEHGRNKKPRVVWTAEMHRKFLEAIHILGHDKAVPKKIVEVMNTPGLTRENVASHLQKYRGGLKRTAQEITLNSLSDSFRTTMDKPFHVLMRRDSFPTQTRCSTTQIPYDSNDAPLVKAKDDYCYTLRSILDSSRTYPKDHFSRFDDQRKMEKLPHISVPTDDSPSGEFNFVGIRLASDGNSIKFGKLDDALKEDGQIRVEADFLAPQASGDDVITTGCVQQSATLDKNSSVSQNQSAQWIPGNETVSSIDLSLLLWEIKNSSPGKDISGEALKTNTKDHILLRDSPEKVTGFDDLSIPELIFPSGNDFLPKAIEARMDDFRVLLQDDMSQQQSHYSPSQMLQVTSDFIEETEVDDSLINTMLSTSSPEFDWEEFCGTMFNNDS